MASFDASNLTDSELRSKLAEYGHPVGPVTETTRKILIKKLKILMKQKNTPRNINKSLTRFSSGDESGSDTDQNGGNKNLRRTSMPPPSSYKTTKCKLPSRNYTSESSSVPSISKVSCSTPIVPSRTASDFKISRYSSPTVSVNPPYYSRTSTPIAPSTFPYEFDSGSDSDVPEFKQLPSLKRRKSSLLYGSLSSYRTRLNNSNFRNFLGTTPDLPSSRFKNSTKKESKPFLSNFVSKFSRKNSDSLNPFDIKESDVEEDGFTDKWQHVKTTSKSLNFSDWSKPFKSVLKYLKSKDNAVSNCYKSWNNSQLLSRLLLGLFLLFFVWLAVAYFKVSQRAEIGGTSGNNYLLCSDDHQNEEFCINKKELRYAIQIYRDIHVELRSRGLRAMCGPVLDDGSTQKPFMTEREVINFLASSRGLNELNNIKKGIQNLKMLILANSHWGITLAKDIDDFEPSVNGEIPEDKKALQTLNLSEIKNNIHLFICQNIPIPWSCYLARLLYKVLFTVFVIGLSAGFLYACYITWNYYHKVKEEENKQVMAMVEKILEYVSEVAERANSGLDSNGSLTSIPQDYVPVRHVHDTLIHPTERQKMVKIWEKATKFIEENESRIRTEVQQVWGEEATVWRWLGQTLSKAPSSSPQHSDSGVESSNQLYPDLSGLKAEAKKGSDRVWQGEAFETSEGSMNSLPSSPTQCLKIRHMFKHDKDYGPDWVLKVKDAIVEKCEGSRIVHISVDKESKEGCVYVKCASPQDAGIAYRQLHGSWFDGALVTVKYLRLERYHERFPNSAYARIPIRPSNNLRLSLQGTAS